MSDYIDNFNKSIETVETTVNVVQHSIDTLNSSVNFMLDTIKGYYTSAHNVANSIIGILLLFEIVFFGLKIALGDSASLTEILKKICVIGAWLYIAKNIDVLAISFVQTLAKMGEMLETHGSSPTETLNFLENPFSILEFAYHNIISFIIDEIVALTSKIKNVLKIFQQLDILVIIFLLVVLILGVGVSFAIITIIVLFIQIEFYFITLCAILLLPFMLNEKTTFISKKIIPSITGQGIKMLCIAIVVNIVLTGYKHVFEKFFENDSIGLMDTLYIATIIALGIYLVLQAQTFSHSITSGMADTNLGKQAMSMAAGGFTAHKILSTAKQVTSGSNKSSEGKNIDLNKHLNNSSDNSKSKESSSKKK